MENLEESAKTSLSKNSFFQHVFKFDDDSKSELLNIGQYSILSIIPIIFLNKSIQKLFPEVDEDATSLELLAEIIGQILVMFIGIFFIHRLVTFIPTYSKTNYEQFNVTSIIIAFLVIVLSLQTRLGEKVNILIDRLLDYMDGSKNVKEEAAKNKKNVAVSNNVNLTTNPMAQSGYVNSNYQTPNPVGQLNSMPTQVQPSHNFDAMYAGPNTPLVGAASPAPMQEAFEPMAANAALGGSGFGGTPF